MLQNSSKLKGTGVFIQRDLTKHAQLKRRILLSYRKIIKTKNQNAKVLIKNNSLLIADNMFYLNENNLLMYKNGDGEKHLLKMFGQLDFEAVKRTMLSNKRHNEWSNPADDVSSVMPLHQNRPNTSTFIQN